MLITQPRVHRYMAGRATDMLSTSLFTLALTWSLLETGLSGAGIAMLALACTLTSTVLTPIAAAWIDRISRRRVLVVTKGVQLISALPLLVIPEGHELQIAAMMFAQWVFWLASDVSWTCGNAFVQENYEPSEYGAISSLQEMILQSFTLLSGALGVLLLSIWNIQQFSLFAITIGALATMLYAMTPYQQKPRHHSGASFVGSIAETRTIFATRRYFYGFVALSCLPYPMLTYLGKLVPVWLSDQGYTGSWLAGWSFSYGTGALLCGALITLVLARINLKDLMQHSLLLMAGLLLITGAVLRPEVLIVMAVLIGLLNPVNRIARSNLLHLEVPIGERGRIEGGLKIISTLLQSASYVMIAVLAAVDRIEWGFAAFAMVLLVFYAGMTVLRSRADEDEAVAVSAT